MGIKLNLNRELLAASLRLKKQKYLYCQCQKPQFVQVYIKLHLNLSKESILQSEASLSIIKNQTNRNTSIKVLILKFSDVVAKIACQRKNIIN